MNYIKCFYLGNSPQDTLITLKPKMYFIVRIPTKTKNKGQMFPKSTPFSNFSRIYGKKKKKYPLFPKKSRTCEFGNLGPLSP